ncbi:MAG: zinc ABC transporter substrate-binding protein [Cyanobacteria bacterium]|nr:zinc ABC transporter substrate-binding protein [Cyanobacteriota bacterium]MDA0866023.1 zinc ABC transporter substrate-binding protein [Cyanobacteriota bacterium]
MSQPWSISASPRGPVSLWMAIALGLTSCTATSTVPQSETTTPEGELQVVTTILPMTQFTKAVAGDRAEVIQLLPPNVGPHDYQAKPADVQAIADADVLVQNGLELEVFLDDLIDNAGNADLAIIDSSVGIDVIAFAEEDHGDDHASHDDHGHDHDEKGASAEADHHHHGEFDPHVWLDPKRAIAQIENIRDGLIAVDPAGEAEYTANATAYIEQLKALDQDITERLAPYAGQTFVSFHDFAFYFADSYGLKAEFLVDVPEETPSPDDVQRILETTEAGNLKALLTEPQVGEAAFAALAKDLKVSIAVFDPMETGETAAMDPEDYFTIMGENVESLEAAFGAAAE